MSARFRCHFPRFLSVFAFLSQCSWSLALSACWLTSRQDVREFAEENVVIILVANKSACLPLTACEVDSPRRTVDLAERDDDRAVSADEARAFAAEHGIEYFETSAKTGCVRRRPARR